MSGVNASDLFSIPVTTISGEPSALAAYRGNVLMVVNVASACGFTPQYAGLEAAYRKYAGRGFFILGFPCNQFGKQEPACEADIHRFAKESYGVTFPLFSKIEVNGPRTHPLYLFLKKAQPGLLGTQSIKWNFTKFLIDRMGNVVSRHGSAVKPEHLERQIEGLLEAPNAR
jgi:glutathione peroxidase